MPPNSFVVFIYAHSLQSVNILFIEIAGGGIEMQRVPVRQRQHMMPQQNQKQQGLNDASPALLLARRVRSEQGVEQLKAYLVAIEPFVAPNEVKAIGSAFGIDTDTLPRPSTMQSHNQQGNPQNNGFGAGNRNQMQMLQMIMNMQKMMKGGGDISQIMKMMGGR